MFDIINRFILSPNDLYEKRRSTQVNELKRAFDDVTYTSHRRVQGKSKKLNCTSKEIDNDTDTDIDSLVSDILDKSKTTPSIVGIKLDKDNDDAIIIEVALKHQRESNSEAKDNNNMDEYETIVELPLVKFGLKLADTFKGQLTSTTLCFVADASSGLGSEMLGRIVESSGAGLALIKEPAWMAMLANILSSTTQQTAFPLSKKGRVNNDLEKIIFGLCRFNAWEIRDKIGENRTVVYTLPGQSSTANLLPLVQAAFPHERHVFIYDGCIDSTARGLRKLKLGNTMTSTSSSLPLSMNRVVTSTTPITQMTKSSISSKIDTLLSSLPYHQAGIVESWLSSVDAFLKLKHAENKTGYTPFVCRLGFLMSQTGRLGNGSIDQSQLALMNVLQYMTGSKSRAIKVEVMDEASRILAIVRDCDSKEGEKYSGLVDDADREAIEECAFAHRGILIENKTLMDTVQPKVEWSLKAAKKLTSCACCMPGEGDEEDEEEEEDNDDEEENKADAKEITPNPATVGPNPNEAVVSKTKPKPAPQGQTYVDGKTMFAFDPTMFG
jgi:hypothetical protein